jgi:asparagine synthase (glutamine-hydrolysing)
MCGLIALYFNGDMDVSQAVAASALKSSDKMLDMLRKRGPDECNLVQVGSAFLGHTRLSIIDLQTGSQPIYNEDKTVAVLLNGEIYNFHELRSELEKHGHRFQSASDTEVIVHLYEECGEDVFSKLNGMFAIVIYDTRSNILLAARDRSGEKPLVYWESPEMFAVTSEIKALLQLPEVSRDIDVNALALYLNSMYVPAPVSIFSRIKKLPPAHYLRLDGNKMVIRRYWDPQQHIRWEWKEDDIKDEFLEIFSNAVKIRTYSDVPFGVFLSGGIDSSAVAAFMARNCADSIKTFTVGFTQEIDERPYARIVAERYRTDHTELLISDRVEDVIEQVLGYFDEPFGDSSAIPTYLVSREARKYVKVILTGDGGDELFAGYGSYLNQKYQIGNRIGTKLYETANQFTLKHFGKGLLENHYPRTTNSLKAFEHWHRVRTIFKQQELEDAINRGFTGVGDYFRKQSWLEVQGDDALSISYSFDLNYYLPDDLLKKVDMASMFASLECRAPFLDHRLIELSLRIPPNLKVKNDCLKYILKNSMAEYLPVEILRRPKTGFGAPVESWLKNHLKAMTIDMLAPGCKIESFIHRRSIQNCLDLLYCSNSQQNDYRVPHKVWLLLVLEIWMRKYL